MTSRQKTWALLVVGLAVVLSVSAVIFVHSGEKSPKDHKVTLTWQAAAGSPGKAVASYNVYRGTISGGPYAQINSALDASTNDTDTTVQSGYTYYYVVTAVDSNGSESVSSSQVQAAIP